MNNTEFEKRLDEINRKLDVLTEQMMQYERRQREWQELKDDLSRIGADMFQAAVTELDEVSQHFDARDLLHLLKKLLRNTRNLTKLVDQMESFADLLNDAVSVYKNLDIKVDEKISYWELFKSARTPEMRRGIAFGFQFLRNLSNPEPAHNGKTH